MNHRIAFLAIAIGSAITAPASAHFLFVRILPPAEGGRAAEVYFSELAEAGDPRFIAKVAHTKLWLQQTPGKFEPLQAKTLSDRLRARVPTTGSIMVVGECEYGVLGRPKQTPFLLRHYPKAIAGKPDEFSKLVPHGKLPIEVVATVHGDEVRFVALVDGKPLPKAEFVTVDAKLAGTTLTADAQGQAIWKPSAPGSYSVYTRNTRKEAGEFGGKKYDEIREFATVAFAWPLHRTDADPKAVALFEEAVAARADWTGFPGFDAKITGNLAGRRFDGTIAIDAGGQVSYTDSDPSRQETVSEWVEEQLGSIVLHRLPRASSAARPKQVLRFAEPGAPHPFGPLLTFDGGKFASSYRVKDRQILVVNRNLGKEDMTITVLDNDANQEGKFLPRSYQVHYWDAATGRLGRTETVQSRWTRVAAWDLPAGHQMSIADDGGVTVRSFTLSGHELHKK